VTVLVDVLLRLDAMLIRLDLVAAVVLVDVFEAVALIVGST